MKATLPPRGACGRATAREDCAGAVRVSRDVRCVVRKLGPTIERYMCGDDAIVPGSPTGAAPSAWDQLEAAGEAVYLAAKNWSHDGDSDDLRHKLTVAALHLSSFYSSEALPAPTAAADTSRVDA